MVGVMARFSRISTFGREQTVSILFLQLISTVLNVTVEQVQNSIQKFKILRDVSQSKAL